MPFVVDQLIYTSFPKRGFKYLASANIPVAIQQIFYQQIISQFWDAYNPPEKNYQGIYFYQINSHQSLFGWLYNNEIDEFGRTNIPYFHCYYLAEPLNKERLEQILACLETQSFTRIERQNPPQSLPICRITDSSPSLTFYSISAKIRQQSYVKLQQQELIQWFVPVSPVPSSNHSSSQTIVEPSQDTYLVMNTQKIDKILKEFAAKPIGIQGVILVSTEGQPLIKPIGFDENSALIMAGTMIYLAKNTQEEFSWETIEQIAVRGEEGHIVLTACTSDTFLLVKTGKAIAGWLEGETKRVVNKLQTALELPEISEPQPNALRQLTAQTLPPINEVRYEPVAEDEDEPEEEIRYRGRSTKGV